MLSYLSDRGISAETAERFRLGATTDGRLVIPYLSPAGPWHLKFRCTQRHDCGDVGHAKYTYTEGNQHHLFNAETLLEHDTVVVVEGELDAVIAEQHGIPAVAVPGAQSWQKHWRYVFDSAADITVVTDGDTPGREMAKRVTAVLRDTVGQAEVRQAELPDGEDTSSFITKYGEGAYLVEIGWAE